MVSRAQALCVVPFCIAVCACATRAATPKPSVLANLLDAAESSDDEEASTALFLLAHVAMGGPEEKRLARDLEKTENPTRRLLFAYVMAVRFYSVDRFIELYPEGKDQQLVWKLETNFVAVPSPIEDRLAYEARNNAKALDKLVSGIPFADGHDAEFLVETIQEIYRYHPDMVREALKKAQIPLSRVRIPNDRHP
jgi:hypothetical protein